MKFNFIRVVSFGTGIGATFICTFHLFMSSVLKLDGWVFHESNIYILYPEIFLGVLSMIYLFKLMLKFEDGMKNE